MTIIVGHEARPDQRHAFFTPVDLKNTIGNIEVFLKSLRDFANLSFEPEVIVTIKNGGVIAAYELAKKLNVGVLYFNRELEPEFDELNHKQIILVDDILDSGNTVYHTISVLLKKYPKIEHILVCTLHFKYDAVRYEDKRVLYHCTNSVPENIFINYFWEEGYNDNN